MQSTIKPEVNLQADGFRLKEISYKKMKRLIEIAETVTAANASAVQEVRRSMIYSSNSNPGAFILSGRLRVMIPMRSFTSLSMY